MQHRITKNTDSRSQIYQSILTNRQFLWILHSFLIIRQNWLLSHMHEQRLQSIKVYFDPTLEWLCRWRPILVVYADSWYWLCHIQFNSLCLLKAHRLLVYHFDYAKVLLAALTSLRSIVSLFLLKLVATYLYKDHRAAPEQNQLNL